MVFYQVARVKGLPFEVSEDVARLNQTPDSISPGVRISTRKVQQEFDSEYERQA